MQLFEPIGRAPGRASPADGRIALWRLLNNRPEFLCRRHVLSSHEHIAMSSLNCAVAAVCDRRPIGFGAHRAPLQLLELEPMAELSRHFPRRGGRAVDRAGLENRKAERPREFESHPLRALKSYSYSYSCSYSPIFNERGLDL